MSRFASTKRTQLKTSHCECTEDRLQEYERSSDELHPPVCVHPTNRTRIVKGKDWKTLDRDKGVHTSLSLSLSFRRSRFAPG